MDMRCCQSLQLESIEVVLEVLNEITPLIIIAWAVNPLALQVISIVLNFVFNIFVSGIEFVVLHPFGINQVFVSHFILTTHLLRYVIRIVQVPSIDCGLVPNSIEDWLYAFLQGNLASTASSCLCSCSACPDKL